MNFTVNDLRDIYPRLQLERAMRLLPFLIEAFEEFEIDTLYRRAAFLGQIGLESGELRFFREIWGPTRQQLSYEGRSDLGNVVEGDGFKFRGRGAIQITGRANYMKYGGMLGVDLVAQPELAETAEIALRIAGAYWWARGCNQLADADAFKSITLRVNGGFTHHAERVAYQQRALTVLRALPVSKE